MAKKTRRKISAMERDTWSLDLAFAEWVLPRLKILKKNKHGIPNEMFPTGARYRDKDGNENEAAWKIATPRWEKIMDDMIAGFEICCSGSYPGCVAKREKEVQRAVDLFAKHFFSLWD